MIEIPFESLTLIKEIYLWKHDPGQPYGMPISMSDVQAPIEDFAFLFEHDLARVYKSPKNGRAYLHLTLKGLWTHHLHIKTEQQNLEKFKFLYERATGDVLS